MITQQWIIEVIIVLKKSWQLNNYNYLDSEDMYNLSYIDVLVNTSSPAGRWNKQLKAVRDN